MSDNPGVVVTLETIYEKLTQLELRLGDHPKQIDEHERRIRDLEMRVWGFAGAASITAIVISLILEKAAL